MTESGNILKTLTMASKNKGYKAYKVKGYDTFGFIITPSDNILTVNKGTWGGVTFSFEYVPSRENGCGCACFEDALFGDIKIEDIIRAEAEGEAFAKRLNAKRYLSSSEWLEKEYWNKRGLLVEM